MPSYEDPYAIVFSLLEKKFSFRLYRTGTALHQAYLKNNVEYHFKFEPFFIGGLVNGLSVGIDVYTLVNHVLNRNKVSDFVGAVSDNTNHFGVDVRKIGNDRFLVIPSAAFDWSVPVKNGKFSTLALEELLSEIDSDVKQIRSISEEYKKFDVLVPKFNELWNRAKIEIDKQEKGRLLEKAIQLLVDSGEGLRVKERDLRTETEELDLVVENSSKRLSQFQSPLFLIECKNWKERVGVPEIQKFSQKVENRPRFICKLGFIISISGFTSEVSEELLRHSGKDFVIVPVEGAEIEACVLRNEPLDEFLRSKILEVSLR